MWQDRAISPAEISDKGNVRLGTKGGHAFLGGSATHLPPYGVPRERAESLCRPIRMMWIIHHGHLDKSYAAHYLATRRCL